MSNPEALIRLLRTWPNMPAGEVREALGITRTTLMRMVRSAGPEVLAFALAPVYDMLPMQYSPIRGGELPPVNFQPSLPPPGERDARARAAGAAVQFWHRAVDDSRISHEFRAICAENRDLVRLAIDRAGGTARGAFCRQSSSD